MRKFRAKTTDGQWIYGAPHPTSLGNWTMRDAQGVGRYIESDTIGQDTLQRDMYRNEVYEGDLIRFKDSGSLFRVVYNRDSAAFVMVPDAPDFRFMIHFDQAEEDTFEVVGNIFDNKTY